MTEIEPYTAEFEHAAELLDCDRDKVAHIYQVNNTVFAYTADID